MKKLSDFFYNKSTLLVAIAMTVITCTYLYVIFIDRSTCFEIANAEVKSLGTSFGLNYEIVEKFFQVRTPEMIACYKRFNIIWDNIFALLYGFMYVFWLSFLLRNYSTKFKLLNLLPFVQSIFDCFENYILVQISNTVLKNELIPPMQVQFLSYFLTAKWIVSGIVFLLIFIGIGLKLKDFIKGRKKIYPK